MQIRWYNHLIHLLIINENIIFEILHGIAIEPFKIEDNRFCQIILFQNDFTSKYILSKNNDK